MQISNDKLEALKQAAGAAVNDAKSTGDPLAIESTKKVDAMVEDLLKKNATGSITLEDIKRFGILVRVVMFIHKHWHNVLDLWDHIKHMLDDLP